MNKKCISSICHVLSEVEVFFTINTIFHVLLKVSRIYWRARMKFNFNKNRLTTFTIISELSTTIRFILVHLYVVRNFKFEIAPEKHRPFLLFHYLFFYNALAQNLNNEKGENAIIFLLTLHKLLHKRFVKI